MYDTIILLTFPKEITLKYDEFKKIIMKYNHQTNSVLLEDILRPVKKMPILYDSKFAYKREPTYHSKKYGF